ncbi:MAG: pyridine nucleotide-disulfide oxidoreductase [Bifidobacteriaceae bacterium]|jgi:ferredoxin--NADP+ reductase|nr:pyridine nucleotide-disulfide oxidoreductase [Bifidobacteriaceae bacterium]
MMTTSNTETNQPPPSRRAHQEGAALSTPTNSPRIAIIGAGPAGLYAADILAGRLPDAAIDVLEALPSPFGLIRYGVAPDHPRIKSIVDSLHDILDCGDIHFYGNIVVGRDIALSELQSYYDVIVLATGAVEDAPLDLPGIDLRGSFGGAEFVAWYDSHPWYPQDWTLDAEAVGVIGLGNVALDIVRVLARRPEDLARTDIPPHVLAAFQASPLKDIHVFGRRGPASVKFSPLELRELGQLPGVQMLLEDDDFQFTDADRAQMAANGRLRQAVKTLEQWRKGPSSPGEKRIHLHFYWRPERLEGTEAVSGLTLRRTAPDGQGGIVDTPVTKTFPVAAVYRAVGYFGSPLPGVPFDAARGVVRNAGGRIVDDADRPVPGIYATGWIKRGPVGLIGSTKSDALETVGHIVDDLPDLARAPHRSTDGLIAALEQRGLPVVRWDGWLAIDAAERALGAAQGRARAKLATGEAMIEAAHSARKQL